MDQYILLMIFYKNPIVIEKLNLLLLDDSIDDAELIKMTLERASLDFDLTFVSSEKVLLLHWRLIPMILL